MNAHLKNPLVSLTLLALASAWGLLSCATSPQPQPIPTPPPAAYQPVYDLEEALAKWNALLSAGKATPAQEIGINVLKQRLDQAVDDLRVAMVIWMSREEAKPSWDAALSALQQVQGKLLRAINDALYNPQQVVPLPPMP